MVYEVMKGVLHIIAPPPIIHFRPYGKFRRGVFGRCLRDHISDMETVKEIVYQYKTQINITFVHDVFAN